VDTARDQLGLGRCRDGRAWCRRGESAAGATTEHTQSDGAQLNEVRMTGLTRCLSQRPLFGFVAKLSRSVGHWSQGDNVVRGKNKINVKAG